MRWLALAVVLVLVFGATACGGGADEPELTVAGAASLTEAFRALLPVFEAAHPDVEVTFNFAGSSTLARQINRGSPADVFVAADERTMRTVVDAGNARSPTVIARNRMMLLVEGGNPKSLRGLADLADPDLVVLTCAREVPCGRLADGLLNEAGLGDLEPASREQNVKAVVAKVTLGEADAGLVYATDVMAVRATADGIEVDGADDPAFQAIYLAAVTTSTEEGRAARAWIDVLRSRQGRAQLAELGFLVP